MPGPTPGPKTEASGDASFVKRFAAAAATDIPPEVREEVQAAARCADQLHRLGRQLRFEQDDNGGIRIEVRDLDGNVLRRVPPNEVFDFASGKVTS